MGNINQAWTYIEEWLDIETKNYDRNALAKGINEKELELFQDEFSLKLSDDFCYSYFITQWI